MPFSDLYQSSVANAIHVVMPSEAPQYSPDTFKALLKKLVQTPAEFTPEDCAESFRHLCVQGASEAQVSLSVCEGA